jgi:hypothetical protein
VTTIVDVIDVSVDDLWVVAEPVSDRERVAHIARDPRRLAIDRVIVRAHKVAFGLVVPACVIDELEVVTQPLAEWLDRKVPHLQTRRRA